MTTHFQVSAYRKIEARDIPVIQAVQDVIKIIEEKTGLMPEVEYIAQSKWSRMRIQMEYMHTAFYEARLDVNHPVEDDGSDFMIHASWCNKTGLSGLSEDQVDFDPEIIKSDALKGFVDKVGKTMKQNINNLCLLKKGLGID